MYDNCISFYVDTGKIPSLVLLLQNVSYLRLSEKI